MPGLKRMADAFKRTREKLEREQAERIIDPAKVEAWTKVGTEDEQGRTRSLNRVWRETVAPVANIIGKSHFRQWIEQLIAVEDDGQYLIVACPTRFHLEWLNTNFITHLERATGRKIKLIITDHC